MDRFALATLPAAADEAGERHLKFYELRDNLDARAWELKRLRYRLLHQSGRIARHARQTTLRLARDLPWSGRLAAAFPRLQSPGAPTTTRAHRPKRQPGCNQRHRTHRAGLNAPLVLPHPRSR
jgi:hypothetical protein